MLSDSEHTMLGDGGFAVVSPIFSNVRWPTRMTPAARFAFLRSLAGQNSMDERQMSDLLSISEFSNKT